MVSTESVAKVQPKQRVIVVGNGPVGHRFVETLVKLDEHRRFDVRVFGEEPRPAYDRVQLSAYFDGRAPSDLTFASADDYRKWGVRTHLGVRVESIDRARLVVRTSAWQEVSYDVLVLATGSRPFVPPIAGAQGAGAFVYRTLDDLFAIEAAAKRSKRGAVIGGGLLGLEAARALHKLGLRTTVIEVAPRLMPLQLDARGSQMLRGKIEALGLDVLTDRAVSKVLRDAKGAVRGLQFVDGTELAVDLVVYSTGIRARHELAQEAGLELAPRGGIVVDEQGRTSDPQIWAIGECASFRGQTYGLVGPGYSQAKVAAETLHGKEARFEGADLSTKLKLMGVDVASFGDSFGTTEGARRVCLEDEAGGVYKQLVVSADGKKLLGGMLVGDASDYGLLSALSRSDGELPQEAQSYLLVGNAASTSGQRGGDMPDGALVCSCNGVTKGALCAAVRAGACDLAALKRGTQVATGCGGCSQLATQIMKAELTRHGKAVSNALCEHFAYSRQELFHLVRVGRFQTFEALLAQHGKGRGCEVCKPAVASIFASLGSAHILEPELRPLQDTNDAFLANIQRDGTYSVVPRVPGGEITPDGLIAIGEVAKRHGLYTKITGGQRVDLFGARLEQLPAVWSELIAAGFESGHAYGKAMRTIKSCVGSTWCRYGVQDSVAMAIRLELRYRGLRAPHKLKSAVSGCTRECAEAQSKDFGVIATEKGWNLYVGGNGGMRPRHADLLAQDIDDTRLVQLIDRFLMFYIRTADRLQRTSTWLTQLEGGVEYLKRVIIDDSLGICEELERDMQAQVDAYRCEWQATLESPEKLARFRQFVNSDARDEHVVFVKERSQIRPARKDERRHLKVV